MSAVPENPMAANLEPELVLSVYHQRAVAFREHLLRDARQARPYDRLESGSTGPTPEYSWYETEQLWEGIPQPEIDYLCAYGTGYNLVSALAEPATTHAALDSLLEMERIRRIAPELTYELRTVTGPLDRALGNEIADIVHGDDPLASIKALRLVCSRFASDGKVDVRYLAMYVSDIVALPDIKEGPAAAEAARLYKDVIDALAAQHIWERGRADNDSKRLFTAFAAALGLNSPSLYSAWVNSKEAKMRDDWTRRNIERMFELERIEPGLCSKLFLTFNTRNFARRSAQAQTHMYDMRMQYPDMPYFISFIGTADHNNALHDEAELDNILYELEGSGFRYEEHECAHVLDVRRVCHLANDLYHQEGATIVDVAINMHGNPNGGRLGTPPADGSKLAQESASIIADNLTCFNGLLPALDEEARVLLRACSTGKEVNGVRPLAGHISDTFGRRAVAPNREVGGRMRLRTEEGVPRLDIDYFVLSRTALGRYLDYVRMCAKHLGTPRAYVPDHRVKRLFVPGQVLSSPTDE